MKPNIMLIFLQFQVDEKKRTWSQVLWLGTPSPVCIYLCMSRRVRRYFHRALIRQSNVCLTLTLKCVGEYSRHVSNHFMFVNRPLFIN
jgi:hypothetical protein